MKLSPTAFFVTLFVVISTVAAVAAPATTRRSAGLFDGPSDNFDVITVIPRDTDVEVTGCSRGWCYVWFDDDEGFVRESLLGFYDEPPPVVVFPQVLYQFGWRYWRQHNYDDWGRWHDRYRRDTRPSSPPPPRRDDRRPLAEPDRRGPPSLPGSRGAPSSPDFRGAPSSPDSRGAPSPDGAPSRDPRDATSAPPPPPGGGPLPPR